MIPQALPPRGEYEIEKLVCSRKCYAETQYLVKWIACPDSENPWESEDAFFRARWTVLNQTLKVENSLPNQQN
jgi:hypothetical protein